MTDDNLIPDEAESLRAEETEEERQESNTRLGQMSAMVEQWRPLLAEPIIPKLDSSLADDDEVFPDYPCSQIAWTGIRAGIDSMAMFFTSLAADQRPYETGHRATARAGLAGAALAVFVLAPKDRETRARHALRAAHDDLRSYERALRDLRAARWSGDPDLNSDDQEWEARFERIKQRRERMYEAAASVGLSKTKLRDEPDLREMVDYAAAHLSNAGDMRNALRLSLAQLNSAVHAGHWHALLGATHFMRTEDGTRALIIVTATDLMLMAGGSMTLLPTALELFRQGSKRLFVIERGGLTGTRSSASA